jgi:hypothetical protein
MALPSGAEEGMLTYGLEDFSRWRLPWNLAEGNVADLRRGDFLVLDDSAERRYGPFRGGDYREVMR